MDGAVRLGARAISATVLTPITASRATFAFTAASILIRGGQGRWKPAPGIFFVASIAEVAVGVHLRRGTGRSRSIIINDVSGGSISHVGVALVAVAGGRYMREEGCCAAVPRDGSNATIL